MYILGSSTSSNLAFESVHDEKPSLHSNMFSLCQDLEHQFFKNKISLFTVEKLVSFKHVVEHIFGNSKLSITYAFGTVSFSLCTNLEHLILSELLIQQGALKNEHT